MKKQDLKKRISEAYKLETPDLQSRILDACENEKQEPKALPDMQIIFRTDGRESFFAGFKRVAAVAACIVLFISGILISTFMLDNNGTFVPSDVETFVYIDVNPSIELQIDGKNKVVNVVAANEDAKIVLSDLKLECIDVNTALKAIVGSMYINGYLSDDSNSVLISVNSKNDDTSYSFLRDITEQINSVFENSDMECAVIAQYITIDDALICDAKEYGVSVGKMHLLNKIVSRTPELSNDMIGELSNLSINDLNLIYMQNIQGEERYEFIFGAPKLKITPEKALENVLAQIGKREDDILNSYVYLHPSISGESKVVYGVNINLPNDSKLYRYEVDCQSGEVFMVVRFATITSDGVVYKEILYSLSNTDTQ